MRVRALVHNHYSVPEIEYSENRVGEAIYYQYDKRVTSQEVLNCFIRRGFRDTLCICSQTREPELISRLHCYAYNVGAYIRIVRIMWQGRTR